MKNDLSGWNQYFKSRRNELDRELYEFNEALSNSKCLGIRTIDDFVYGYFELEDKSVLRVRKRNDNLWAFDGHLHLEASELEILRQPKLRLIITERRSDFHVCFEHDPDKWECGLIKDIAIVKLMTSYPKLFNLLGISNV